MGINRTWPKSSRRVDFSEWERKQKPCSRPKLIPLSVENDKRLVPLNVEHKRIVPMTVDNSRIIPMMVDDSRLIPMCDDVYSV